MGPAYAGVSSFHIWSEVYRVLRSFRACPPWGLSVSHTFPSLVRTPIGTGNNRVQRRFSASH